MSFHDLRGCPTSSCNSQSLQRYEQALDLSAGYFMDPLAAIQDALDADPEFLMGHCLRAGLALMATDRAMLPLLVDSVGVLHRCVRCANDRERAHLAAAHAWLDGDFAGSIRRYGDILLEHPHDLLALQIAHLGDFFLGASSMLRDRIAQVLPLWSRDMPGYGHVLGMYAFGLEETGAYSRAEETGRRALEVNRRDPWAVHAVVHVTEMQGRAREGIEFLAAREPDWAPDNGFAFHNWWHLALLHLDLGEHSRVLELYDQRIRPGGSQVPLAMIDASAMLWRLQLRDIDIGSRWSELAEDWAPCVEHAYYAFNDVHAVMAFLGARRFDLAHRTIAALERKAGERDTNAMMSRDVGLPLARALLAYAEGHYGEAVDLLLPVRAIAHRFGGSHAQRDLIHLTLLEAALRAGQGRLARALSAERTERKPASIFNWQLASRARALRGQG